MAAMATLTAFTCVTRFGGELGLKGHRSSNLGTRRASGKYAGIFCNGVCGWKSLRMMGTFCCCQINLGHSQ